jgi:hypothetical protein
VTEKLVRLCRQFFGDPKIDLLDKNSKTAVNAFITGSSPALVLGLVKSKSDADSKDLVAVDLNTTAIPDFALYFVRSKIQEDIKESNFNEHVT